MAQRNTGVFEPEFYDVVLYHDNCFDGKCAEWAFRVVNNNVISFGISHSKPYIPAECLGKSVLLLDFCYKQEMLNELMDYATFVTVVDHHKTTLDIDVSSRLNCKMIIDMTKSGCQMIYDLLFETPAPYKRIPMVDYIGDRDMWKWDLPNCKEINAYIYSHDISLESLTRLNTEWNMEKYVSLGKVLLQYQESITKNISKSCFSAKFKCGDNLYNVIVGDCSYMFRSDVGAYLNNNNDIDFAVLYTYYANTKKYSVSLRGKDKHDLSSVAKFYGGGGHPNASAFGCTDLNSIIL